MEAMICLVRMGATLKAGFFTSPRVDTICNALHIDGHHAQWVEPVIKRDNVFMWVSQLSISPRLFCVVQ